MRTSIVTLASVLVLPFLLLQPGCSSSGSTMATGDGGSSPRDGAPPRDAHRADAQHDGGSSAGRDSGGKDAREDSGVLVTGPFAAVWAASGMEKVWQYERRVAGGQSPKSSVFDGTKILVTAAREEVPGVNLILETKDAVKGVTVSIGTLTGPGGAVIANTTKRTGNQVFSNKGNPLQVFAARYVQITGINDCGLDYCAYVDERVVPPSVQLPRADWTYPDAGMDDTNVRVVSAVDGGWTLRPGANQYAPDALIPMEVGAVDVAANTSQLFALDFWVSDSVIGHTPAAGVYRGTVSIAAHGAEVASVPIELTVVDATLPFVPSHGIQVIDGASDTGNRFYGNAYPNIPSAEEDKLVTAETSLVQLLHSYRLSPVETAFDAASTPSGPSPFQAGMLTGSGYSAANGYYGPGQGTGDYAFMIGTYGSWADELPAVTLANLQAYLDTWARWFSANAPSCDRVWYVADEPGTDPTTIANINTWLSWQAAGTGPGKDVTSFVTEDATNYMLLPTLKRFCSTLGGAAVTSDWTAALAALASAGQEWQMYNGSRAGMGTVSTEGSGPNNGLWPLQERLLGVKHPHFFWYANYYDDYQNNGAATANKDIYNVAMTFGPLPVTPDPAFGWTANNGTNGDGVLVYPGTDFYWPKSNYGLDGYFPSFRLRAMRLGINLDLWADLASKKAASTVTSDIAELLGAQNGGTPVIAYNVGVQTTSDPTYQWTGVSWSEVAEDYEAARLRWVGLAGF